MYLHQGDKTLTSYRKTCLVALLLILSGLILSSSILPANAAPTFQLDVAPSIVDMSPSIPGYFSIRVTSLFGFSDAVYFELVLPDGFPQNAVFSFQPDNHVTPPANGFGYAYLRVEIPSTVMVTGQYSLTVKASSGTQSATKQILVRINFSSENFALSIFPPSQTIPAGTSTSYAIYLQEMGAMSGQVVLLVYDFPNNGFLRDISPTFTPVSVRPTASSTMQVLTSKNLAAGTYYLAVGGEYGSLRHTSIVGLTVTGAASADFDFVMQPTTQYIAPGVSTVFTILVVSKGGFNAPVGLSVSNVPSGVTASLSASIVTPPSGGVGYSLLMISSTKSAPTGVFQMLVSGLSGTLSDSISAGLVITTSSQFATLISPSSVIIAPGQTAKYEVTVNSVGDFSSPVSLDLNAFPGITYRFDPRTVTPSPNTPATSILTVTADINAATGAFTLVVKASSSKPSLTQYSSTALILTSVSDFAISASPSSQTVTIGGTASFPLTISSLGGFSSDVQLGLTSPPPGIGYSFDQFSVRPSPGSPRTATLTITTTIDAKVGTYLVMTVGSSAGIVRSYAVAITINPIATYLTIAVSPTTVKQTNTVTVSGTISPKIAGAAVTLTYTKPDGTGLTRTVTTDTDGKFSDSIASEDMGSWQVYASWQGDNLHAGARSAATTFQVTEFSFIDRYGFALGAVVLIVLAAAAVLYFRSRRATQAPSEKKPAPPSPPAPVVVEVPTPVIVEVPRPVVKERREAPPLILPRKSCFNCGEVISAQAKFCDKCRAPQPEKVEKKYEAPPMIIPRVYCANCGEVISAQAAFCDKCRAPQT
jgi:uncharacterized membrane protein